MASCTAITMVNGRLVGDPLDVQMFQATDWVLDEDIENQDDGDLVCLARVHPKDFTAEQPFERVASMSMSSQGAEAKQLKYRCELIRRFDFSSELQRMSVICKNDIDQGLYKAFVKGSPEKISELCRKETLPEDFNAELSKYTSQGYRVIALSYRDMPRMNYRKLQTVSREEVETELTFLGLLIMENKLKEVTSEVIRTLKECDVGTVMATGDNILTAISVAGQCGIIDPQNVVYLGDLALDKRSHQPYIEWECQLGDSGSNVE